MINWNLTYSLATSCEELTHWKRLWCWEGLGAGRERDDRGWDGWMASLTRWTWVWVNSGSWWWTRGPGVLQFMGSQRVGHDWVTELNWTCSLSWLAKLVLCSDWQTPCLHFTLIGWLQACTSLWLAESLPVLCPDCLTSILYFALI